MAVGLPAKFTGLLDFTGSRESAVRAAAATFDVLGWSFAEDEYGDLIAKQPATSLSWGEKVRVTILDRSVLIQSVCRSPMQIVDWGVNRRNVERFISIFSVRQSRQALCEPEHPMFLDENNETPVERMLSERSSFTERKDV